MIRRLTLVDFMAHGRTVIDLPPGLTALTGPNNSGKSAVVEALRCLAQNPPPRHVIRHGAAEARVSVTLSDGTVIAYLTDRMLAEEGFSAEDRQTVSVPSLGDRMALLGSGEIQAAMLPEPLTTLAAQQGAVVVLDDSKYPEYSHSTITFRKEVLDQNPDAVRAFLAAVEEAVTLINADPAKYEKTLVELNIVPAPLEGKFAVPQFVTAGVPSEAQFQDVLEWATSKGLVDKEYAYSDLITAEFLP